MKYGLSILSWMLCICLYAQKAPFDQETERALRQLDSLVAQKESFHAARNEQIGRLKQQAAAAAGQNRLTIYKEILALYTHYQTDSAQVYLDRIARNSRRHRAAGILPRGTGRNLLGHGTLW